MFQDNAFQPSSGAEACVLSAKASRYQVPQTTLTVARASCQDLSDIHDLEKEVEGPGAASRETLTQRLQMFRNGFLVAKSGDRVAGYLQSTLWRERSFQRFSEICDFPRWHTRDGQELYLIFLAVSRTYRSNGLASHLLTCLDELGHAYGVRRITLVAKKHLIPLYEKNGFQGVDFLPDFLPTENCPPVLMHKPLD